MLVKVISIPMHCQHCKLVCESLSIICKNCRCLIIVRENMFLPNVIFRIHGIAVSRDKRCFDSIVDKTLDYFGIKSVQAEDILDAVDGYVGLGYGLSRKEEMGKYICANGEC